MEVPHSGIRQCTICNKLQYSRYFYRREDICDNCIDEVPEHIPKQQNKKYLVEKKKPERQMF